MSPSPLRPLVALLLLAFSLSAAAQDVPIGVTFVCNDARLFIENCNIRDTSDTSRCMVGHPDTVLPNGLMKYTYETRGDLKKLLPTCKQPSAQQPAQAKAFQQKQQDLYNANVAKANQQMAAVEQQQAQQAAALGGPPPPPSDPQTRAMYRCVTAGRLPASCTGNALLGQLTSMIGSMTSKLMGGEDEVAKAGPDSGPEMAGVFVGAGNWRIDFVTDGVLVNCAFLSPDGHRYKMNFRNSEVLVTLDTTPRPITLTVHRDNTITAPGPVTIDGVIAGGSSGGGYSAGHLETQQVTTHQQMSALEAQTHAGESGLSNTGEGTYDLATTTTKSTYVPGTYSAPQTTFVPKRATCPALNLSTKGATVGIETMQTDLLKTMFGGDKGAPTPPGIRMRGIYAATTGFSVQFFPESVVLGCGPDAARAYPYSVAAEGSNAVINVNAPDHPLKLVLRSDGSLDPGSSDAYQVHGRFIAGENGNGDNVFGPLERSCSLAVMRPSKTIPANGGTTASVRTVAGNPASLSTPDHVLGNATLSITSGFPPQPGAPNPLAAHPYTLLRDSFSNIVTKAGVAIPAGSNPYKVFGIACGTHSPDCQKIINALKSEAVSAVRADSNGSGTLPGVAPGTYYLLITARYNNQAMTWERPVILKPGANSLTLSAQNATPLQ